MNLDRCVTAFIMAPAWIRIPYPRQEIHTILARTLPRRLALYLTRRAGIAENLRGAHLTAAKIMDKWVKE